MSVKGNYIEGDTTVGRDLAVGRNAEVAGSAHIGHNLKVDGWLEANIKGAGKGCFMTDAALRAAYPNPTPGDWAMVGTDLKVWTESNGDWANTNTTATVGADTITMASALEGRITAAEETIGDHERALGEHDTRIDNVQGAIAAHDKIIGEIALNDLDLDDFDKQELFQSMSENAEPVVCKVTYNRVSAGVLMMFNSGNPNFLTQVLATRNSLTSTGKFGGTITDKARIYQRTLNGRLGSDLATWGAWEDISGIVQPWQSGSNFAEGTIVSYQGSLWKVVARVAYANPPSNTNTDYERLTADPLSFIPKSALTSEPGYDENKVVSQKLVFEQLAGLASTINSTAEAIARHFVKKLDIATELGTEEEGQSDNKVASQSLVAQVKQEADARIDSLEENVSDHASALTEHDTRISNVQTAVESLSADAEGHMQMLGEQSARITSIDGLIAQLEARIAMLEQHLNDQ